MGSFRAWLGDRQLNEILDLKAENFPDVRLIGHGDSYKSKFRSIDRDGTSNEYAAEFHLGGHSVNERDENYNIKTTFDFLLCEGECFILRINTINKSSTIEESKLVSLGIFTV